MIDTCTFCKNKQVCSPTNLYLGYCDWKENEPQETPAKDTDKDSKIKEILKKEEKGDKSNEDSEKKC